MQLCRFHLPGQGPRLGQIAAGAVRDLTGSGLSHFATLAALLQASTTTTIEPLLQEASLYASPTYAYADLDRPPAPDTPHLLPPVDRQEVWAAGVTYAWSREARVREAQSKEAYVRVYEAERLDRPARRQSLERPGAGAGTDPEPPHADRRLHDWQRRQQPGYRG